MEAVDRITDTPGLPRDDGTADAQPRLMLFGVTKLSDMLEKGNVWYVRLYEVYYARVDVLYCLGGPQHVIEQGATRLVSVGKASPLLDLLLAPYRIYRHAKRFPAVTYLTADQVFSWWTGLLLRWLLGARVILMPVSFPEELYRDYSATLSGMPIWMERLCLWLSYKSAYRVMTAHACGGFVKLMQDYPLTQGKLTVLQSYADALPPTGFVDAVAKLPPRDPSRLNAAMTLVYVGRLNQEKLVEDLLQVMRHLRDRRPQQAFRLQLIGDGPDRQRLESMAQALGIANTVEFIGALDNAEIPRYLLAADAFLSPLTGMSLREAALCGVPIIAYNRDWVVGMLKHDETALLVPSRDTEAMAAEILNLADNEALRCRLAAGIKQLAVEMWSPDGLRDSLKELHGLTREAA
jgi:glycosyltransferase involved in cell wall biosynthesis